VGAGTKNVAPFNELRESGFAPCMRTVRSFAEFTLPRKFNDEELTAKNCARDLIGREHEHKK
jgi:hypothetical protein